MPKITTTRLMLLRGMYLFMAVGLALFIWPTIFSPPDLMADQKSVIRALLGAIGVLAALGVRYPVQMLPLLLFELLWKCIWVFGSALPMWLHGELDAYASDTLFACLMGVILVPIAMPWPYVFARFVRAPAEPWLAPKLNSATPSPSSVRSEV